MSTANHYEMLGVAATAPVAVIKAAHRVQMREHHPDAGGTDEVAKRLNEALGVLADSRQRAAYDAVLALEAAAAARRASEAAIRAAHAQAQAQEQAQARAAAQGRAADAAAQTAALHRERERVEAAARARGGWTGAREPAGHGAYNVFERNRIDLPAMDWYTRYYPPAEILPESGWRAAALRWFAWFLLDAQAVLAALFAVGLVRGGEPLEWWRMLVLVLLGPGAALAGGWARARARGRGLARYLLFLVFAGGILAPALADGRAAMLVASAWLGAYVLMVESFRATAATVRRPRSRLLTREETLAYNHWDLTGPGNTSPADSSNIPSEQVADLLTGQLLEKLHVIPGAKTLAPVAFPGDPGRCVGHAVLCGDRLALIDSSFWPGGQYYWWEDHLVCKLPGRAPELLAHAFPAAVQEYRRLFPDLQVRGWSVLHRRDGADVLVNNRAAGENPPLVTAAALLEEAGNWLGEGQAHTVDRMALSRLVHDFAGE